MPATHSVTGEVRAKGRAGRGWVLGLARGGSSALGFHSGEGAVSAWDTEAECSRGVFLNLVPNVCSL